MKTRTDIHRPGVMVPSEYVELAFFEHIEGLLPAGVDREELGGVRHARELYNVQPVQAHGGLFSCDLCGAHYKMGSVFLHEPTGDRITVGHICAEKVELLSDRAGAASLHELTRATSLRAIERAERRAGFWAWARENRELLPLLRTDHHIVQDIRARLIETSARWGLTPKQEALVRKLAHEATLPPEVHVPVPVDGERIVVEGTVVSVKTHRSQYGDTEKMVVKVETPDGSWLCYGSVPQTLWDGLRAEHDAAEEARHAAGDEAGWGDEWVEANPRPEFPELRGRVVRFTAKVTRGNRDPHFGFFSRPTKGGQQGARTRCPDCGEPVPVDSRKTVSDGRGGLLHIKCNLKRKR